jgi:hypothetical protein
MGIQKRQPITRLCLLTSLVVFRGLGVNLILWADRNPLRMSKSFRIQISIFGRAPRRLAFLSAVIRRADCRVYSFPLCGKESFRVARLDHPLIVSLKHEELDDCGRLLEPTDCPD